MYFNIFESRNEYGCDPVGNNVVYVHANLYELHFFYRGQKFDDGPSLNCERNKLGNTPKGEL